MSNIYNERLLENLFDNIWEELVEKGYSEAEAYRRAELIAWERIEEMD